MVNYGVATLRGGSFLRVTATLIFFRSAAVEDSGMIKINNWSSYQSYKDRRPPWIRFHRTMLDNYEYHSMSANARALLPMLWLLASEDENPVSGLVRSDYKRIAFRLRISEEEINDGVCECEKSGFVTIQDADNAGCIDSVHEALPFSNQSVPPETERETYKEETETEREREALTDFKKLELTEEAKKFAEKCDVNGKSLIKCWEKFEIHYDYIIKPDEDWFKNWKKWVLNERINDKEKPIEKPLEGDELLAHKLGIIFWKLKQNMPVNTQEHRTYEAWEKKTGRKVTWHHVKQWEEQGRPNLS